MRAQALLCFLTHCAHPSPLPLLRCLFAFARKQRYDASEMANGAAHPITNNVRGTVTCPSPTDLGYEDGQSCTMKPVVGDSGDSTKGCPKVFTYSDTEFLGYDAAASDNSGPIFGNEAFPATVDYDLACPALAISNCATASALCPLSCDVTYNLTKIDIPNEGTIVTTSATGTAKSFFGPAGSTDTIGTDCEPFAIKFACYDGADNTNIPLPAVYTDYAGFNGARMHPQATDGTALAHILTDTLVIVHNNGLPLPENLRCEIEGPRELCFGPPTGSKGETATNSDNEDHEFCPPVEGEPCFDPTDQTSCENAGCAWVLIGTSTDGICRNNWPCSGRGIALGAPGVRSCGIPGLHDLGFTTDGTTSVHLTRPYLDVPDECTTTDMFYNDKGCDEEAYATCNVPNAIRGTALDPLNKTSEFWDYTQQGAFLPTGCCNGPLTPFKPTLGTSLYLDRKNQLDDGDTTGLNSFLHYFDKHTTGGASLGGGNPNNLNDKVGPVSLAGLLPTPASSTNLQSGCAFGANPTCDTTYSNTDNEGVFDTPRSPLQHRSHFGGQGSGICYPVQGSTGVPFGTNGAFFYNTFAEKSLPSTYNPWFKQVLQPTVVQTHVSNPLLPLLSPTLCSFHHGRHRHRTAVIFPHHFPPPNPATITMRHHHHHYLCDHDHVSTT
jgi:hypothetical protein